MKLVNKVTLYNLLFSFLVLIFGGILLFIFFDRIIKEDLYDQLDTQLDITIGFLKDEISPEKLTKNRDVYINSIKEIDAIYRRPYRDKIEIPFTLYSEVNRYIPSKKLFNSNIEKARVTIDININNQWYRISCTKDKLTPSSLYITSTISLLILLVIILLSTIIGNRFLFKKLFTPFYTTLNQLKSFNPANKNTINFTKSTVDEFSFLNENLTFFIEKIQHDYIQLKEFTENASHELQTPIAIIKSKLDLLQQSKNLDEQDFIKIEKIQKTLQKTKNLNKALLLLSKIENNEFIETKEVNIKTTITHLLADFSEISQLKELIIITDLNDKIINANPFLIDILLKNLILNAIKHNIPKGNISILLKDESLIISNDGPPLDFPSKQYFLRFKKGNQKLQSTGLGLAIVKQICVSEKFEVSYTYNSLIHTLKIIF